MNKWKPVCTMVALLSVVAWGCNKPSSTKITKVPDQAAAATHHDHGDHDHAGHDHAGHDHAGHDHAGHDHGAEGSLTAFCGDCGHKFLYVSTTAQHKCDTDHEICDCGFHKGSDLCCKIEGDFAGSFLCGKCGDVVGSEKCCIEGATICECGFAKGAPLCCKLVASTAADEPADEPAESDAEADEISEADIEAAVEEAAAEGSTEEDSDEG